MLELVIVRIIESCNKNSSKPLEWRKTQENAVCMSFQVQMRIWSISTWYIVEWDRLHGFFHILILYHSVTVKLKRFNQNLFAGWPNKKFRIDISNCSSGNDFMLGHELTLLHYQQIRIIDTFLPQRTNKIARISEKFQLTDFEFSNGFC